MGTTTIVIVGASGEDQGEVVEIKPVGFGRRAQVTFSPSQNYDEFDAGCKLC